jgi:hypothetical protein
MSQNEEPQTRRDIEARIIAKAWKDEAYKQELLTNPKAVIEREFGVQFTEEISIQIREENPTALYFVLPMRPQIEEQELSEKDLEEVSGGLTPAVATLTLYVSYETFKDGINKTIQGSIPK